MRSKKIRLVSNVEESVFPILMEDTEDGEVRLYLSNTSYVHIYAGSSTQSKYVIGVLCTNMANVRNLDQWKPFKGTIEMFN